MGAARRTTLILLLTAALAFTRAAQVEQKKDNNLRRTVETNWRVPGGPQRDFLTTSTGLFKAGSEKWMATPPKKLWERPLGNGPVQLGILCALALPAN
jgi:hypothetical protein